MPWDASSVMEERIKFVIRASQDSANMSALCREFGVSRPTGYLWLARYLGAGSVAGIFELTRRPHHSPRRTPEEQEGRIVALRREYGWGARKIRVLLLQEGMDLKVATINRILSRRSLIHVKDSHRPAVNRFEREHPNQLWQMDFKGDYPLRRGRCYPLSILDDHSRFIVGLYALSGQDTATVSAYLISTFKRYGVPEAMLMDHGVPWWANANGHGLTRLSVSLIKQGIRLYFSGVRHPQTQGKVERFHRTLTDAVRHRGQPSTLPDFAREFKEIRRQYNYVRPHESLQMTVPSQHYQPSSKSYIPKPVPWEYPEGATLVRLNMKGGFYYRLRRHFVCEALAGEIVRLEEVDNKLLISYRHTYLREIDFNTGKSTTLLQEVTKL